MLRNNNINKIMFNFELSDSNKDGSIDKKEFKKEVNKIQGNLLQNITINQKISLIIYIKI